MDIQRATPLEVEAREAAILAYCTERKAGALAEDAAKEAWRAARRILRSARAPDWVEKYVVAGTHKRSYRSPLGELLSPWLGREYGSHSANWPRTIQSLAERDAIRTAVIDYLENECNRGTP